MSKLKSAIFSLGAKGTIADTLTFQKRNQATIVRKKPIPKDPYSLAQAYQRWDYQDGIYYWKSLTLAAQKAYQRAATPFHMIGFAYFMHWYLANLPDLVARWHLDTIIGTQTPDSSKNTNPGTVYGAQLCSGIIDKALYFDQVDDWVKVINHTTLEFTEEITIEFFFSYDIAARQGLLSRAGRNWEVELWADNRILFGQRDITDAFTFKTAIPALHPTKTYHIALVYNDTLRSLEGYRNGDHVSSNAFTNPMKTTDWRGIAIGGSGYPPWHYWYKGIIDEVTLRNRCLVIDQIKNHSQRVYPP